MFLGRGAGRLGDSVEATTFQKLKILTKENQEGREDLGRGGAWDDKGKRKKGRKKLS